VLEGSAVVTVGSETREVRAGEIALCPAGSQHGVANRSGARAALLVFMAPHP
jgi:quercetin dioxygenase-like cupin family protein